MSNVSDLQNAMVKDMFDKLDKNKDGKITLADVRSKTLAELYPEIERYDKNKDGEVTFEEFRAVMLADFEKK